MLLTWERYLTDLTDLQQNYLFSSKRKGPSSVTHFFFPFWSNFWENYSINSTNLQNELCNLPRFQAFISSHGSTCVQKTVSGLWEEDSGRQWHPSTSNNVTKTPKRACILSKKLFSALLKSLASSTNLLSCSFVP